MNSNELRKRQTIEREYHDRKYSTESESRATSEESAAYGLFNKLIEELEPGTVLDFGCGDGWLSLRLAKRGHKVYGIDISRVLIDKARKWAAEEGLSDRVRFEEMPGENLRYQQDFFDVVIGSAILHHTELSVSLRGLHGVLKHGGKGIFIEPMNEALVLKVWRLLTPWRRSPTERALTLTDIATVLQIFPKARLHYFTLTSMLGEGLLIAFPRSRLIQAMNRILERFDQVLVKRFPSLGSSCGVVVMELVK